MNQSNSNLQNSFAIVFEMMHMRRFRYITFHFGNAYIETYRYDATYQIITNSYSDMFRETKKPKSTLQWRPDDTLNPRNRPIVESFFIA